MSDSYDRSDANEPSVSPTPRIRVFGGVGVDDGDQRVDIGGPKQHLLLALLAVRAGEVLSLDWLAENLWDDEERPEPTTPALRTYVSRLRRSLPGAAREWIETQPSGYRLSVPDESVDHRRFAALRSGATRARGLDDPLTAQKLLDEALALWDGDPFRELEDFDWARADIEQLRIDRLEMMEERWDSVLALGGHTQITGELAAFTAEYGLRDRAARQHALALHRSGRTTEALRVIDEHRRTLAEESGLEPSAALVELEHAILAGDSSLMVEKEGRPLRGYRLLEEIGNGAFSIVWRGVQPSVNREVAIKQIRTELASQPDFIRRFEAEAQLVARIEHPHIVPMIDFWRDPDSAYLVMRWLRGGTLERRLDDGPMTVEATLALARQIGGALAAAHSRGVVHRDVKAANILFDEEGHSFLTDFGIALDAVNTGGAEAALSQGSPAYAAPEQIRREPLGPRADIFSLAVVIYECLAGSLPFRDSASMDELVDRQLHAPYPPLSDWRPDLPASITQAVARATAKNPADRFTTVGEFVDALEPVVSGDGSTAEQAAVDAVVANPYQGLRAFHDTDRDNFFGRERLTAEMVGRLAGDGAASRGLVVVGPSGSGKSSVVRAGLAPALRAGAVPGSSDWFSTTMVPGGDPFESLEAALLRVAVDPPPDLLALLRDGDRGVLRGIRQCLRSDRDRVVLIIDQFEELFTAVSSEDASAFLSALTVAVEDPTSPVRLVATLRADYYHRPLEHPDFARILRDAAVDVTPLAGDEMERAIVEPAARVGVGFEAGLVARIAAESAGQASPLPLLQYLLSELFERRSGALLTQAAYNELGGLGGALTTQAEGIHDAADEAQRSAIRRVFGRMANPIEQSADLRRRVPIADLGADPSTTWVLDRFGAARLLTFDRDESTREPTVEVAHEALLREWPRLVGWLREDLELLRTLDAVSGAATAWDQGGRADTDLYRGGRLETAAEAHRSAGDRFRGVDREFIDASQQSMEAEQAAELRRVRRLRRLVGVVGAALVVALIAGGLAVRQQQRADDEARRAQAAAAEAGRLAEEAEAQADLAARQTVIAEEQTAAAIAAAEQSEIATLIRSSATLATEDPELAILLALEAHRRGPGPTTEQAVLDTLGSGTVPEVINSYFLFPAFSGCDNRRVSGDGWIGFGQAPDGVLVSGVLAVDSFEDWGAPPDAEPCVTWMGDETLDRRWAQGPDGLRLWLGSFDSGEPWGAPVGFDQPTFIASTIFTAAHRLVARSETPSGTVVGLINDRSGEWVAPPIDGGGPFVATAISPDGSYVALSFATPGSSEGGGRLVILDGATGREVADLDSAAPLVHLAWDPAAALIAATTDGRILAVDAASATVVAEQRSAATSNVLDIGVRPDGLILVVSQGLVEVIDRVDGAVGQPKGLSNVVDGWVRSDGIVIVLSSDSRVKVLDVDGSPLGARVIDVDPFARFAFSSGLAAGMRPDGQIEVVDLATGETSNPPRPVGLDGTPLDVVKIYAESDGLWAITADGLIARYRGGELVGAPLRLGGVAVTGTRFEQRLAVMSDQPDGRVVDLVSLDGDAAEVVFRVDAAEGATTIPSLSGGVHVVTNDEVLTYDAGGERSGGVVTSRGVFDNQGEGIFLITLDPTTGNLALAGGPGGVLAVDTDRGEVASLATSGAVANLGFARQGQLLVITALDGTVRLWDLERNAGAGTVWSGSGALAGSPSWYDEASDTVWVNTSGKLLQVPLDPADWFKRACVTAGRNLDPEEWDRYVPGDELLWFSCLDQVRSLS